MDTIWRIIVGDKKLNDRVAIERAIGIADLFLKCFTLLEGVGFWYRVQEKSLCFEFLGTIEDDVAVLSCAEALRKEFDQTTVIVTRQDIAVTLVEKL